MMVTAVYENDIFQGEPKFIYTSPRALDEQGNKMTWVLPIAEDK